MWVSSRHVAAWVLGASLGAGCHASRALAPLEAGQHAVTVSAGGPFVEYAGAPVPLPFVGVGWRYGIDGRTDVHAAVYPTGPILIGVFSWDLGVSTMVLDADGGRPRIMLDMNTTWHVGDNGPGGEGTAFRMFLQPSAVFTWDLGKPVGTARHHLYVGGEVFYQPFPQARAVPGLMLGTEIQARPRVGVQLELGWHGFHRNTDVGAVTWIGPGNVGSIRATLGVNVRLPKKGEGRRAQRAAGGAP